ncbi:hypothetical protein ULG90_02500 [Halopseudomonas pachastrellae]|nr:hypothetical protein ULG90_02500 [Halopseudomonas pachastrellae]
MPSHNPDRGRRLERSTYDTGNQHERSHLHAGLTHGITEENRKDVLDEFDTARRSFLRNTLVGGGAVGLGALGLGMTPMAHAASGVAGSDPDAPGPRHYYIPASPTPCYGVTSVRSPSQCWKSNR